MTTRAQQRANRAAARLAAQQAEERRRRQSRIAAIATVLVVLAATVALVVARDGGEPEQEATGAVDRLLTTAPPWEPQAVGLPERLATLGFPDAGDESYHAHTLLSVYRNGEQVTVPANIGFDTRGTHSSLHTHTPDGVIHMEADDPYAYTLSEFFTVWGVAFDENRLGGDVTSGDEKVYVYVNGEPAPPGPVRLEDGDNVVVAYGTQDSFPKEPPADALQGA